MNKDIQEYKGYPQYKLLELYPNEKINYRRGNTYENFFSPDFEAWQDYFCTEYEVEKDKDVLVFHSCSWSKPYDMSHVITPIRNICNKYDRVHRVILSNVGVVPYEYQMNPSFLTYDFPPICDCTGMNAEEIKEFRIKVMEINYYRIFRYLKAHRNDYTKVITYLMPLQYGMCNIVDLVCKELNIECVNVISKNLYGKYKNKEYFDSGEFFIEEEVLGELERVLAIEIE